MNEVQDSNQPVGVKAGSKSRILSLLMQTFGGDGAVEQLHLYRTTDLEGLDFERMAAQ